MQVSRKFRFCSDGGERRAQSIAGNAGLRSVMPVTMSGSPPKSPSPEKKSPEYPYYVTPTSDATGPRNAE